MATPAQLDLRLFRLLRADGQVDTLTPAIRAFSSCGEHAGIWLALGAAGAVVDRPRRARWRRGLLAVVAANATNALLKLVVGRRRPTFEDLPPLIATPTQLSFPSAHAATSFAAARAYRELLPAGPLLAVAAAMAASRVYLGVHYPSDVVAGALLGTTVATIVTRP